MPVFRPHMQTSRPVQNFCHHQIIQYCCQSMEKILTDGVITDGRTSIDESMVTGERGLNLCWAAGCNAIAIPLAADILYPVYQFLLPPGSRGSCHVPFHSH